MQTEKISSFHTHTYLCKHAEGTVADYLAVAESDGCSALGFSDHCPYPKDGMDTWPEVRMTIEQAPQYIKDIRNGAKDVSFPVYCSFECEYDKRYHDWYKELKGRFNLDYLVFGPHWVYSNNKFLYAPRIEDTKDIHNYFDTVIEGIYSGLFNFVAHPDLIMANGRNWTKDLESCFCQLIDSAIKMDLPLEINGVGITRPLVSCENGLRHPYPVDNFWKLAKEKGAKIICNSDAHKPSDVIASAVKTRKYAERFGFKPLETIF
ncbi:MAG: histidinol-phosphatase [Spirochaetaceae bacterium]|nr:histidinol-phosphatase [Spirochaetaceae bacterium]